MRRRRYKRDGSDVLGLMHYDQRVDYLMSQVRCVLCCVWRDVWHVTWPPVCAAPAALRTSPTPHTRPQIESCRQLYPPPPLISTPLSCCK